MSQPFQPRITYPSPAQVGAANAMATLGALPLGNTPEDVTGENGEDTSPVYALAAVGGAAVGGGLIGWVAAGDLRGAGVGSLLTASLASLSNAAVCIRRTDRRALGVGLGAVGLVALASSLFLAARRPDGP
jgi:hypothetical protein